MDKEVVIHTHTYTERERGRDTGRGRSRLHAGSPTCLLYTSDAADEQAPV